MGYMGLSHWCDSDGAADFRFVLQKAVANPNTRKSVQALVRKELRDMGNQYNTDGPVNVALVMEDEGQPSDDANDVTPMFSNLLTKSDFTALIKGLQKLIKECGAEDEADENMNWHRENFERMLKFVKEKAKKA